MDTGEGRFASLHPEKANELKKKGLEVFRVGEMTHLKGSKFEITGISENELTLRLVPIT